MKKIPALVLPKWLASEPVLLAPRCAILKVALALIHFHGKRDHGASSVVDVAPEVVSELSGVPVKAILSLDSNLGDVQWSQPGYGLSPIVQEMELREWPYPNPPKGKEHWKLRKLRVTLDPALMNLAWGKPGVVKVEAGEFVSYKNRGALMLRLRIGSRATTKSFMFSILRTNREWAFGSNESMSALSEKYLYPAVDELNSVCADFHIVHSIPRMLGDRKPKAPGEKVKPWTMTPEQKAEKASALRFRHIQRIDMTVKLRMSKVRLSRTKSAWLLPESYEGKQPKIVPVEKAKKKRAPGAGRPRKIVPPPLPLFDAAEPDFKPAAPPVPVTRRI